MCSCKRDCRERIVPPASYVKKGECILKRRLKERGPPHLHHRISPPRDALPLRTLLFYIHRLV